MDKQEFAYMSFSSNINDLLLQRSFLEGESWEEVAYLFDSRHDTHLEADEN